ncbi:unnamed protein product, partial [Brachionus calyciflorus]
VMFLVGCALNWILILQYAIRLSLKNDIRFSIIILICVDGLFEFGAALIVIISNAYCTGYSTIQASPDLDYAYLEIIGAAFLLVFALVLLLIAGIVYFMRKKKKEALMINNFKPIIMTGTPSTMNHSQISNEKPPININDFWLSKENTRVEEDITNEDDQKDDFSKIPSKPKKLTPIFSRKRAEIAKFHDFDEPLEKKDQIDQNLNQEAEFQPIENQANALELKIDDVDDVNVDSKNFSDNLNENIPEYETKPSTAIESVKEMPTNPFDFIWNSSSIAPSDTELKLSRKNTTLGGRAEKLSINPETFSITGFLNFKETKIEKSKKPLKSKKLAKKESKKKNPMKMTTDDGNQNINNNNDPFDDFNILALRN